VGGLYGSQIDIKCRKLSISHRRFPLRHRPGQLP
jgi:hypothetical protein